MLVLIFCSTAMLAEKEMYARVSGSTVTFYYDENMTDADYSPGDMREVANSITMAVFDSSFTEARPTSTRFWFYECENLQSIEGMSNLNTSNVTDFYCMFGGCSSLTSLDVSNFDTSNATSLVAMFTGCSSLTNLDVSHFDTSNVTEMNDIFSGCSSLTSLDVSHFNTSNVSEMRSMFNECRSLASIDVSSFNTNNVIGMGSMFAGCSSLQSLDVSNFNTSNVTAMYSMFCECSSLTSLDLRNFDTSNVTDMSLMFGSYGSNSKGCSSLTSLDLSNFNTSQVTDMSDMFQGCTSLTSLDLSNFDTRNVTHMESMFLNCNSLQSLDVSNFNTSNVTDMSFMFSGCSSLTSLDVSSFDTRNVTSMYAMFGSMNNDIDGCRCLTGLDLSNFNTSNVTDMCKMFEGCSSLTSIDVSNFDTSKVIYIYMMFDGCSSLTSIDISSFNTSNVEQMFAMFSECKSLYTIYVSDLWSTESVIKGNGVFEKCEALTGEKGTSWYLNWYYHTEDGYNDFGYARVDGGSSNPGYFTYKAYTPGISVNSISFPNSTFRDYVSSLDADSDGKLTEEEIAGVASMNVSGLGIQDLTGIGCFTALSELNVSNNQLKSEAMDNLIAELPEAPSQTESRSRSADALNKLYVMDTTAESEGNEMTESQAAKAVAKGWQPYYFNGTEWVVFTGGTPSAVLSVKYEKESTTIYTLSGQRTKEPQKGICIINGKKMIVR